MSTQEGAIFNLLTSIWEADRLDGDNFWPFSKPKLNFLKIIFIYLHFRLALEFD